MKSPIQLLEHELERLQYKLILLEPNLANSEEILKTERRCTEYEEAILLIIGEN